MALKVLFAKEVGAVQIGLNAGRILLQVFLSEQY